MLITISITVVFKFLLYMFASFLLFIFCCWPINDQPTSGGQYITFTVLMIILFVVMFIGFPDIDFVR